MTEHTIELGEYLRKMGADANGGSLREVAALALRWARYALAALCVGGMAGVYTGPVCAARRAER